jgi:beta-mannosidase
VGIWQDVTLRCFVEIKDLRRPPANLRVEKVEADTGVEVRVAAGVYAYFVKLTAPVEGSRFSDNYFDLFPGQEKVVRVWNALGQRLAPDDIAVSSLPPTA